MVRSLKRMRGIGILLLLEILGYGAILGGALYFLER
jgi:hypothetical protein